MPGFTTMEVVSDLDKYSFSGVVGKSLMQSGLDREWEKQYLRKYRQLIWNSTVKRSRGMW